MVYFYLTLLVLFDFSIDLIRLMSMPTNDIDVDPAWGFKVVKTSSNEIYLEMKTHDGTTKSATASFLMGIMIKHHIKAIKDATGEKPDTLGLYIFDKFTVKEKSRVEAQLAEACDLLSLKCHFI